MIHPTAVPRRGSNLAPYLFNDHRRRIAQAAQEVFMRKRDDLKNVRSAVAFGSFISSKDYPNDIDILLFMKGDADFESDDPIVHVVPVMPSQTSWAQSVIETSLEDNGHVPVFLRLPRGRK